MKIKKFGFMTRTVVLFILFLLVVNIILGVFLVFRSRASTKELLDERMLGIVKTAGAMLDGDDLNSLTKEDVGGAKQNAIAEKLKLFSNNLNFKYIYIVRKVAEGEFIFIVDPDPVSPAEFGESVVITPALVSAGKGIPAVDDKAVSDKWGNYYSTYCPVLTSDGQIGGIVGVDFDAEWYEDQMSKSTVYLLLSVATSVIAGGGIVLLMTAKLRRKFEKLNEETKIIETDIRTLMDEINSEFVSSPGVSGEILQIETEKGEEKNGLEKLSEEVRSIKLNLKRYIAYVRVQAYTDGMTGVGNKTAYLDLVREINQNIEKGTARFSIAVFDVNGLKNVNDDLGHEMGDGMLTGAAKCIKKVFGKDNVFRIGGDEFIAILPDFSEEDMILSFEKLNETVVNYNSQLKGKSKAPVSFSKGTATFKIGKDKAFREVFKRADQEMYKNKDEFYRESGLRR